MSKCYVFFSACVLMAATVCAAEKPGYMEYGGYYDANNEWIDTKWCQSDPNKCSCPDDAPSTPQNSCVQVKIDMGRTRYSAISDAIVLQMNELNPTTAFYSPSGFRVVFGEGIYGVSREKTAGGVPKWVYVVASSGARTTFVFADGESVGMPTGTLAVRMSGRLVMVDANGWATATDPAYYDYYPGDGSRWRFGAAQASPDFLQFVEHRAASGRTETANDVGVETVRDADGVLLQVVTPGRVADFTIVGQDAYDLTVYPNDASCLTGARAADGRYVLVSGAVPEAVWKFRNPAPGTPRDLDVTVERPGAEAQTWRYEYKEAVRDFTLKSPGNQKEERLERFTSDDGSSWVLRRTVCSADGLPFKVDEQRYRKTASGSALAASVRDPGGLNLATTYDYFIGGTFDGLERLQVSEDGSWIRYEYDNSKRVVTEIRPWLDSPTNAPLELCAVTRYGYGLFAAGDFLAYNDQRPRTEIKEICGVEVSRTYHAYPTNALGQVQEIMEQAAFPGAPYGHTSNPRTVKTYCAATAALPLPGRLATITYPGGKTEAYGYEYGTFNAATFAFTSDPGGGAWRETVTTSYGANSGVQTLRSARVWDEKGREVLNESCVEDGAAFAVIGWTRMTYDRNGKLIETSHSDGRVVSAAWGANCCGKESATTAEGIVTVYGYNELKQKVSETKKGMAADGSEDIATLYTHDLAGRVLSTAVTNYASGLGYVASRNAYDAVGRVTNSVDRLGNPTVTAYDALAISVRRPNGVTAVTERYLDGQAKRVLENGVVKQSYAYGVNPAGTRWTLSADGPLPAAVQSILELPNFSTLELLDFPWQLQAADTLDRSVAAYKPGFGGTTLVTSNSYNTAGNLVSSTQYSVESSNPVNPVILSRNLFSYRADGARILSASDLDFDGSIDLSGPDRVTGTATAYEKIGDDWFSITYSMVYPEVNAATVITSGIQRVQITGRGVFSATHSSYASWLNDTTLLTSLSQSADIRGNISTSVTLMDRDARKVTHLSFTPTSVQPSVQTEVNGLTQASVSSMSITNSYTYDALGRLTSISDGRGNGSTTVYTSVGLVAYTEDTANNRTSYGYDIFGRRSSVTDALNNTGHFAYDTNDRILATWGSSYPVAYEYDSQGRQIAMATTRDENYRSTNLLTLLPAGETLSSLILHPSSVDITRWLYDEPTGLLTNKLYAEDNGPSYTYTPYGKLVRRIWARGITTDYTYNNAGALINVDYSDSTPDVTYSYDRLGNQISAISSVSTNTFVYSSSTLELDYEIQNGMKIDRNTDTLGRNTGYSLFNPENPVQEVFYSYNTNGQFSSVFSVSYMVSNNYSYSYLPGSDIVHSMTTESGVAWSRYYEDNRNLVHAVSNSFNNTAISSFEYENNAIGRRITRNDYYINRGSTEANSFDYNEFSEVTNAMMAAGTYSYFYDPIGNRNQVITNSVVTAYEANGLNQYTNITGDMVAAPAYDLDGNLIQDSRFVYTWDAENRLLVASNLTTAVVCKFVYDQQSRRISKTTSAHSSPSCSLSTKYSYDGWNMICEQVSTNLLFTIQNSSLYTWGLDLSGSLQGAGGVGGLLSVINKQVDLSPKVFFAAADANGNITEYVDSNGSVVAHYEYDSFGVSMRESGTNTDDFSFRFSSKSLEDEVGLYFYGYRYYAAELGRWLNRDPLEELVLGKKYRNISYLNNEAISYAYYKKIFNIDSDYCFCLNGAVYNFDLLGLYTDPSAVTQGNGYIQCDAATCTVLPGGCNDNPITGPKKCCLAHEQSHIGDLDPGQGCYWKDCKCVSGGLVPDFGLGDDPNDFKISQKDSECKAYLEQMKCCKEAFDSKKPLTRDEYISNRNCLTYARMKRLNDPNAPMIPGFGCTKDPLDDWVVPKYVP